MILRTFAVNWEAVRRIGEVNGFFWWTKHVKLGHLKRSLRSDKALISSSSGCASAIRKQVFIALGLHGPWLIPYIPHENKRVYRSDYPTAYAVTVDSLETFLGLDLFPSLPDTIETTIEANLSLCLTLEKVDS